MGRMRVNFSEIEGGFAPVDEGDHEAIIETCQVRESNSSEHNYLNFEFTLTDDPFEGRKAWLIRSLSDRAMGFLKDLLVDLEVIAEDDEIDLEWDDNVDITPKEGPELLFPEVAGIPVVITIKHTMYEGRVQGKVVNVALSGGSSSGTQTRAKASTSSARSGRARRLR